MLRLSHPEAAPLRMKSDCGPGSSTHAGGVRRCSSASVSDTDAAAGNKNAVVPRWGTLLLPLGATEDTEATLPAVPIIVRGCIVWLSADSGTVTGVSKRGVEAVEAERRGVVFAEDPAATLKLLTPLSDSVEGTRVDFVSLFAAAATVDDGGASLKLVAVVDAVVGVMLAKRCPSLVSTLSCCTGV